MIRVDSGVPQGSVLGPKTIAYVEEMDEIFEAHGLHHHGFADDIQTYMSVPRSQSATVAPAQLQNCIAEIVEWCGARSLQLNASKTDLLWYGSSTALKSLSSSETNIVVGNDTMYLLTMFETWECSLIAS